MEKSFSPIEHYPDRWRKLKEIQAISNTDVVPLPNDGVDVHTLQHLWSCMEQELNNAFITTSGDNPGADEHACSRWEKMLGIIPSNEATLDDRQFAIYTRLFQMVPYTYEKIRNTLASILGEEKTTIDIDVENQTVKVIMTLGSRFKIDSIGELMDSIVPANMILIMDIDHTTHDDLSKYAHDELTPYTHEEIRITEL